MAQVTHRPDAGHARATLERVQYALQFGDAHAIRAVAAPAAERGLGLLEKLGGLLAEDRGDVCVESGLRALVVPTDPRRFVLDRLHL